MQKSSRLLYLLAFIKLVIPFFLQNSYYEPHRDEFLYLAEGNHMAWGFMEVPPLLSVFAWLTNLFGSGMFWIKIWPALFGAFTFILVGKIIISLGGKTFALILGWLPFMLDGYMRLFFLFQPNFLEVFFWTAIAYSIIRYIQTNKNNWLYIFGISIGLGMMSKYSVAFYTLSIMVGLFITRHRKIFLNRHLYYAGGIALLIVLPNFIWQYTHHFPVITHMKELQDTQLQYINPSDFIISQFMMNLPCIFIWLAGLFFVMFPHKGKPYRPFAWAYLSVIILLIALHGKDYYALGAYPVLFAFGAYQLEQATAFRLKWTRYALMIFALSLGLFAMPVIMPVAQPEQLNKYYEATGLNKTGSFKWEDLKMHPLPQDFADMISWKEMTEKVAKAYNALDSNEKKHCILFCDNYGQAGAVNYYGKAYHLPPAYSDNASFLYWLPDSLHIDNIVLLTDDENEMQHDFIKDFTSAVLNDSVANPYARERGSLILTLKGANEKFNNFFKQKIAEDKAAFK
ncbi:MAG: glycosyltransferase family 39 protein [Panacibacter sp.]